VITGASRGIGLATALLLQRAGYRVVGLARHPPVEEVFECRACDVADSAALMSALESVGRVDVLVNNAGSSSSATIESTSLDDWSRALQLNATSVFVAVRAVLPNMKRRNSGRIITIASIAGLEGGRYITAYSASKHAAVGLMRSVAAELTGSEIGAATICPTFVMSDMTHATIANIAARTGASVHEAKARLEALTPCGRILEPEEVAEAVLGLVTLPVASMNGQLVVLDGCSIADE
jgi:NAD(P)-dependent dehydrogenase (short-subunit alcohol dehydrogenase family)